jgi:hypothetical protein
MTADELEQIKHRAASCYVGTAWRGAIADVRKLIDAVDAMNLQLRETRYALGEILEVTKREVNAGTHEIQMIAKKVFGDTVTEKRVHLADDGVRVLDECGQVKCETLGCDVRHNPEWSDGTPRYGCSADGSTHEVENRKKRERK